MNPVGYPHTIILLLVFAFGLPFATAADVPASPLGNQLWRRIDSIPAAPASARVEVRARRFKAFALDTNQLRATLANAPLEFARGAGQMVEIGLPMPDGTFSRFKIEETQLMEPELAAKFPEIKTYRGRGIDDPAAILRLDINATTVHAQILSPSGTFYIDPYWHLDSSLYISYAKSDLEPTTGFNCLVESTPPDEATLRGLAEVDGATSATNLRTYRFACATSLAYSQFHSANPANPTVQEVMAAIATMLNRVNGIFETQLGIRLVLVGNNDLVIATATNPTPYTNNAQTDAGLNSAYLDQRIGAANYDIGHVLTQANGGWAGIGVVCLGTQGWKALGSTGFSSPTGDLFWNLVAHEIGHQFGAHHTFNGDGTTCGTNGHPATAFEPGSGSTLMAYAGICSAGNNLQSQTDPYFHFASLQEIFAYVTSGTGNSCPVATASTNNPPTVDAGPNFNIPARTPFTLTALNGSDPDGDPLTYCWEEADLGPVQAGNAPDNGSSPILRSFLPTSSPTRTVPKLSNLLNNTSTIGEQLPSTTRALNFRVTVRDNKPVGGFAIDAMTINVTNTGLPFQVTSPNTAVTWAAGSAQTVTWNVAGTTAAPISAANVKILLSTSGGNTFPTVLIASTPNDGSEQVILPNTNTSTARIKVEAVGNIFFDISNVNFTIGSLDADGDGMPDNYESANGLNPNNPADANTDLDGDTQTNYREFQAGTDPRNAASVLRIVSLNRTPTAATITFTSVSGKQYVVEASVNLINWSTISGNISGTGNNLSYNDANAGTFPRRFYRARLVN